jgi:uncharacterized repeat protein (TIGR03803 family)
MKYFCGLVSLLLPLFIQAPASSQTVSGVFSFSSAYSSANPEYGTPMQGRDGALYGTTTGHGQTVTTDGAVFRIAIPGTFKALHDFSGADGQLPYAGLTLGTDGDYYGTTTNGGSSGLGVLFKLTSGGAYTILHDFAGGSDGATPFAPPILASDGNFYGTTDADSISSGVIYQYQPSSGAFNPIFSFNSDQSQGVGIFDPLIQGADGNLYGTAQSGGVSACGTLFELSTSGVLLQLYSFPCGAGGWDPIGSLMQASDGNIYGVTEVGGITNPQCAEGCGTIFKFSGGTVSVVYSFSGPHGDGQSPITGLTEGTDGNLYGTTALGGSFKEGSLYQLSLSGQYRLLYSFNSRYGRWPYGSLLQHTNGKFYGTTGSGGAYNEGSLYSLNMGLSPFIALVRYTGNIGRPVQILGQGLKAATAVTVNGVAATSFKIVSDTYMTAVIPAGATTGPVVVTTATGTLTSNQNLRIVQ